MIKNILLALILIAAFPAYAADKETAYDRVMRTGTIKVGYAPWPPYQIHDPNTGELSGVSADYMNVIASLLDLKIEWVQVAGLGSQVEELKQGRYDVSVNDGPWVFSMIKFVDFSDPLYYAPIYAYGRVGETRFKTLKDLNSPDVTFVGIDGDLSVDLARRSYPKAKLITLAASTDPGLIMQNVQTNKADVALLDPGSVATFNKNNPPGMTAIAPPDPVAVYPVGFSVMKGDDRLLTMINGAVAAMLNTNAMQPILDKWLPEKGMIYPVAKPYEVAR